MNFASHYKLDNLCAIFDVNRLGQSDPTMLEHDFDTYKKRTEAFGWVQWININEIKNLNYSSHVQKCNFEFMQLNNPYNLILSIQAFWISKT